MEFFKIVDVEINEELIRKNLVFKNLPEIYPDFILLEEGTDDSLFGTLWGEFTLTRHEIKGGLRFALKECPNAAVWTVTTGYSPAPEKVVIHLTVNRTEISDQFREEIEEFIAGWTEGITRIIPALI